MYFSKFLTTLKTKGGSFLTTCIFMHVLMLFINFYIQRSPSMDFFGPMYYWHFLRCIRALYIRFILLQELEKIRVLSLIKNWTLNKQQVVSKDYWVRIYLENGAEQALVEKPKRDRLLRKTRLKKSTTTTVATASIVKAKN